MIHDVCDYCRREFGYQPGDRAICMNCGAENVRTAAPSEVAMVDPASVERAVLQGGRGRRRK
jgi:hypothetical protein